MTDPRTSPGRVLVLGASGFVGLNLTRALLAQGRRVRAGIRQQSSRSEHLQHLGAELTLLDVTAPKASETIAKAAEGCCAVINLAASLMHNPRFRAELEAVNIRGAATVAAAALDAGVRLTHVSTTSALSFPQDGGVADETVREDISRRHYGQTKRLGEQAALARVADGLDVVVAYPGSLVGGFGMHAHQRKTFDLIAAGRMVFAPPGGLCVAHVTDVARGLILTTERGRTGEGYILGGDNITYMDYFRHIARATGGAPPRVCMPKSLMQLAGRFYEMQANWRKLDDYISREQFEHVSRRIFFSSEKARRELGYAFTPCEEAIHATARELGFTPTGEAL